MKGKLFCFSPPVMLATFGIEIIFALYVLLRYKLDTTGRLVVALLAALAAFQLAEFNVCAGGWIDPDLASRLGYVVITLLPPIGLHLVYALAATQKRPLLLPAYVSAAAFAVFFLLAGNALTGNSCQGNYVIFQMTAWSVWLYGLYYYGWLFASMALCYRLARGRAKHTQKALYWFAIGYLAFIVPTTIANLIEIETLYAIPSIMCGFAVLLAIILTAQVIRLKGTPR